MIKRFFAGVVCIAVLVVICDLTVGSSRAFGVFTGGKQETRLQTVIIDAGHGGFDGGAVAQDGTVEKEINLAISLKLESILSALGFKTVMVRTTDTAVNESDDKGSSAKVNDIKHRVDLMKRYPEAVLVSIHMNKYGTTQPHGAQIFYAKTEGSDILAKCIQSSIILRVQNDNKRVIKPTTSDIYLLKNATTPAVIAECGFLSNPTDLKNLKNDDYQLKIAFSIAVGIIEYYKNDV